MVGEAAVSAVAIPMEAVDGNATSAVVKVTLLGKKFPRLSHNVLTSATETALLLVVLRKAATVAATSGAVATNEVAVLVAKAAT